MDFLILVLFFIIHISTIIFGLLAVILWKKEKIGLKHIVPTVIFGFFDILLISTGASVSLPFLTTIIILIFGTNLRSDNWPTKLGIASYYNIYIFLITLSFIPSISLITFSLASETGMTEGLLIISVMIPIMLPGLLFVFSDPTNAYDIRNPDRIIGSGFGFMGAIIGLLLSLNISGDTNTIGTIGIVFSIIALIPVFLIFISSYMQHKDQGA